MADAETALLELGPRVVAALTRENWWGWWPQHPFQLMTGLGADLVENVESWMEVALG